MESLRNFERTAPADSCHENAYNEGWKQALLTALPTSPQTLITPSSAWIHRVTTLGTDVDRRVVAHAEQSLENSEHARRQGLQADNHSALGEKNSVYSHTL